MSVNIYGHQHQRSSPRNAAVSTLVNIYGHKYLPPSTSTLVTVYHYGTKRVPWLRPAARSGFPLGSNPAPRQPAKRTKGTSGRVSAAKRDRPAAAWRHTVRVTEFLQRLGEHVGGWLYLIAGGLAFAEAAILVGMVL